MTTEEGDPVLQALFDAADSHAESVRGRQHDCDDPLFAGLLEAVHALPRPVPIRTSGPKYECEDPILQALHAAAHDSESEHRGWCEGWLVVISIDSDFATELVSE